MHLKRLSIAAIVLLACGASHEQSPASGSKADDDDQWIIDIEQGCKIPRTYASYAEQLRWDGPCFEGEAMGSGTLRWVEPDGSEGFYKTCLRAEHPQSKCTLGP